MHANRIASQRMPEDVAIEGAAMESTFHILKVPPDGPLTQMCTMKCPRGGSTASKEPEEQFKCDVVVGNCASSRDMLYVA